MGREDQGAAGYKGQSERHQLDLYLQPRDFGRLFDDPRWGPFIEGVRGRVAAFEREFRWPPA